MPPLVNTEARINDTKNKKYTPPSIVSKINKRKRLLKLDRQRLNNAHYFEIKQLSHEIQVHFHQTKREHVERVAMGTGTANGLWKAVKIAKNVNFESIPTNLTY